MLPIGERLRRAIVRSGLTQKEVAFRASMDQSALSDIVTGTAPRPSFESVEKIVRALELSFSEVFDEPRLRLSAEDAELSRNFQGFLNRLLATDAALKKGVTPPGRISSRRGKNEAKVLNTRAHKKEVLKHADVELIENPTIPARYQPEGARYAYTVLSDVMLEEGIMEGSTIYVRHTAHYEGADDQIVICKVNDALLLRRLDYTSGRISLHSAHPSYEPILIDKKLMKFVMVGVVVRLGEE
jgi:transcriptional regulator with XRE-family HTH domain